MLWSSLLRVGCPVIGKLWDWCGGARWGTVSQLCTGTCASGIKNIGWASRQCTCLCWGILWPQSTDPSRLIALLPQMEPLPSPAWLLSLYAKDILPQLKAHVTSVYGAILKMDSTKKVTPDLVLFFHCKIKIVIDNNNNNTSYHVL